MASITLPTASVVLSLELSSGDDAGITQDTAYMDAALWAQVSADVTSFAASYGYEFTVDQAAAGTPYTGRLLASGQGAKNWIATVKAQGDLATSPPSGSSSVSSGATGTLIAAGAAGAAVIALGTFLWWRSRRAA